MTLRCPHCLLEFSRAQTLSPWRDQCPECGVEGEYVVPKPHEPIALNDSADWIDST